MEKSFAIREEISWVSVIFGAFGILLLCAYILWIPDHKDTSQMMHKQQTEIEQQHTVPNLLKAPN